MRLTKIPDFSIKKKIPNLNVKNTTNALSLQALWNLLAYRGGKCGVLRKRRVNVVV
ncbi:MAG: hypothetical protein OQK82_02125 [Candidatus Pacearchaeota archaeon]|nr:hypothetical protein [Candidatus Pacearchaeota archaeon]